LPRNHRRAREKNLSLKSYTKIGLSIIETMMWPVAMYGGESWTMKKADNEENLRV